MAARPVGRERGPDALAETRRQIRDLRAALAATRPAGEIKKIDLSMTATRREIAETLEGLSGDLAGLQDQVRSLAEDARRMNAREVEAVRGSRPEAASPAPAETLPAPVRDAPETRDVSVAREIRIPAVWVDPSLKDARDIYAAIDTPQLYYIESWDHFAFRVGAVVFHGNVGAILPQEQSSPVRVKDCWYGAACKDRVGEKGCEYYHDPAKVPGSRDVRNYMRGSWSYMPSAPGAHYGARRIGDRRALEGDLKRISEAEARRFFSQVAHDVLIAIILDRSS